LSPGEGNIDNKRILFFKLLFVDTCNPFTEFLADSVTIFISFHAIK